MERGSCEFICGAPTTFQGYGIEKNRMVSSLSIQFSMNVSQTLWTYWRCACRFLTELKLIFFKLSDLGSVFVLYGI